MNTDQKVGASSPCKVTDRTKFINSGAQVVDMQCVDCVAENVKLTLTVFVRVTPSMVGNLH